jgi:hypothetical protein
MSVRSSNPGTVIQISGSNSSETDFVIDLD